MSATTDDQNEYTAGSKAFEGIAPEHGAVVIHSVQLMLAIAMQKMQEDPKQAAAMMLRIKNIARHGRSLLALSTDGAVSMDDDEDELYGHGNVTMAMPARMGGGIAVGGGLGTGDLTSTIIEQALGAFKVKLDHDRAMEASRMRRVLLGNAAKAREHGDLEAAARYEAEADQIRDEQAVTVDDAHPEPAMAMGEE